MGQYDKRMSSPKSLKIKVTAIVPQILCCKIARCVSTKCTEVLNATHGADGNIHNMISACLLKQFEDQKYHSGISNFLLHNREVLEHQIYRSPRCNNKCLGRHFNINQHEFVQGTY